MRMLDHAHGPDIPGQPDAVLSPLMRWRMGQPKPCSPPNRCGKLMSMPLAAPRCCPCLMAALLWPVGGKSRPFPLMGKLLWEQEISRLPYSWTLFNDQLILLYLWNPRRHLVGRRRWGGAMGRIERRPCSSRRRSALVLRWRRDLPARTGNPYG